MSNIFKFIKNYRKILLVGIVGMILVLAASTLVQYLVLKHDIKATNEAQLEKIVDKYDEVIGYVDSFDNIYSGVTKKDISILTKLLIMEPQDYKNTEFLNKATEYLLGTENILLLNSDRRILNQVGTALDIDYTGSYYDPLFATEHGEYAELTNEGSDKDRSATMRYGNNYVLIQTNEDLIKENEFTDEQRWDLTYRIVGLDANSGLVVVNAEDDSVVYTSLENLKVNKLPEKELSEGKYVIDDEKYYVQSYKYKDSARLVALTPTSAVWGRCVSNMGLIIVAFVILLVVLTAYIVCLREDETDPEDEYIKWGKCFLHKQTKMFRALALVVILFVVATYLIVSTLTDRRYNAEYLRSETDICLDSIDKTYEMLESLEEFKAETMYNYCRLAGEFLAIHSEYSNKAGMSKLAQAFDVEYMTVFASDGSTLCTSSSMDHINITDDPKSSLYDLRYVLMGKEGVGAWGDSNKMSEDEYIYAVPRRGSDGIADGAIAITTIGGLTNSESQFSNDSSSSLFNFENNENGSRIFFVDKDGYIDGDLSENESLKMPEESLKNGFIGTIKIDGRKYMTSVSYVKSLNKYLYVTMPADWFTLSFAIKLIMTVLLFMLMSTWMWFDGLGSKYHFEKKVRMVKDADDWERTELYWEELSIGKKMGRIMRIFIYIMSCIVIVGNILQEHRVIGTDGIGYIFSDEWHNSVNGYSIIGNVLVICVFFTVTEFIEYIITKIENIIGDEASTFCRLLCSLVKYISVVICIYVVVTNFGLDAATALASIGIAGLALSFGAQELVKDMISGMFLLVEGKFKVGDMIEINGDWYWIRSIGVRSTTLEAWGQIQVVNNSNMTGIVNIQNASSVVNVDIMIDNKYNVDRVKEIIMAELPALKSSFPASVSTPSWKGVQDVSAAGTVIRMRTYCQPLQQGWVGRKMRQEIKRILEENGIEMANEAYVVYTDTHERNKDNKDK